MSAVIMTLQSTGENKEFTDIRFADDKQELLTKTIDSLKENTILKQICLISAGNTILVPQLGWMRVINIKQGAHEQTDKEPIIVDNGGSFIMEKKS